MMALSDAWESIGTTDKKHHNVNKTSLCLRSQVRQRLNSEFDSKPTHVQLPENENFLEGRSESCVPESSATYGGGIVEQMHGRGFPPNGPSSNFI
ncbi:hypothetical protein BaRGS_00010981 [Batillaria attramentaria]|uniref:Uncharacterized protein n=1 Tax=Batillaria attramentaria TaxID=370345 RepID=A0ABD0LFK6_9CAEN